MSFGFQSCFDTLGLELFDRASRYAYMTTHMPVAMGQYIFHFGVYNNYAQSIMDNYNALDPEWGVIHSYLGPPVPKNKIFPNVKADGRTPSPVMLLCLSLHLGKMQCLMLAFKPTGNTLKSVSNASLIKIINGRMSCWSSTDSRLYSHCWH